MKLNKWNNFRNWDERTNSPTKFFVVFNFYIFINTNTWHSQQLFRQNLLECLRVLSYTRPKAWAASGVHGDLRPSVLPDRPATRGVTRILVFPAWEPFIRSFLWARQHFLYIFSLSCAFWKFRVFLSPFYRWWSWGSGGFCSGQSCTTYNRPRITVELKNSYCVTQRYSTSLTYLWRHWYNPTALPSGVTRQHRHYVQYTILDNDKDYFWFMYLKITIYSRGYSFYLQRFAVKQHVMFKLAAPSYIPCLWHFLPWLYQFLFCLT